MAQPPYLKGLPWLCLVLVAVLLVSMAAWQQDLLLNDSFRAFARAEQLAIFPGELPIWVHPFYPVGYPWLIRILVPLVGNAHVAAQILSVSGALCMLAAFIYIGQKLYKSVYVSWLQAALVILGGVNFHFLQLGSQDNTDMPSAGGIWLSLAVLVGSHQQRGRLLLAGALLGGAYLMRYTALTIVPAVLIALVVGVFWQPASRVGPVRNKAAIAARSCGFFLVGFLAISALQWVPSLVFTGNPFYNNQAANVHFALTSGNNWGIDFAESMKHTSLLGIILDFRGKFFYHYALNIYRLFFIDGFGLWVWWLYPVGMVILVFHAIGNPHQRTAISILLLSGGVYAAVLSLAFITQRTTLFLFPLVLILALAALERMVLRPWVAPAIAGLLLVVSALQVNAEWRFVRPAFGVRVPTEPTFNQQLTATLVKEGMSHHSKVLSLSWRFYHARHPYRVGFPMPWNFSTSKPVAITDTAVLDSLIKARDFQFIISDEKSTFEVPGLKNFWPQLPARLRADTLLQEQDVTLIRLAKRR